uniref:Uncharacterized protein n=1 Tax=Romanomermis culicivorax TaxID=13658 RepID=A0A915JK92_ROMCU
MGNSNGGGGTHAEIIWHTLQDLIANSSYKVSKKKFDSCQHKNKKKRIYGCPQPTEIGSDPRKSLRQREHFQLWYGDIGFQLNVHFELFQNFFGYFG